MIKDLMADRSRSRLTAKEQSKLAKRTVLLLVSAVGLVLVFIFVILPGFISIVNSLLNRNPLPSSTPVMVQAPVLNAPLVATNSAQFTLTGFASPKQSIQLLLNSQRSNEVTAGEDGQFAIPVTLHQGDNEVSVFAKDNGVESAVSQVFSILFDGEVPALAIDEPTNEAHFDYKTKFITIRGVTEPGALVMVNGRLSTASNEGVFQTSYLLSSGKNEIAVVATDQAGNSVQQVLIVYQDS